MIEIATLDEMKESAANDAMCKHIGYAIQKAYPSRNWYVEVVDRGESCVIKIPEISMEWGAFVHLKDNLENNVRTAVKYAGELLERFNLTRGNSDNHDLMSLNRDYKGVIGASKGEV